MYSEPWHLKATCSSSLFLHTQQNLLLKNEGPLQLCATGSCVVKTEARNISDQKNQAVWVQALARIIGPLSTQVNEWVLLTENLMLDVALQ